MVKITAIQTHHMYKDVPDIYGDMLFVIDNSETLKEINISLWTGDLMITSGPFMMTSVGIDNFQS